MLSRRICLLGLSLPLAAPARGASLRLLSEHFPPINFEDRGRPSGLAGELVIALQDSLKLNLPVEFMPWARAYAEAQRSEPICLFTMARSPQREKLFKWVGPIVDFQNALYAPAGVDRRLRSLDDAGQVGSILVVRDWASAQALEARGLRNLTKVSSGEVAVRMLLAHRAHLLAADRVLMPELLHRAGLPPDALSLSYAFPGDQGYLAFSLATPDREVQRWQQALDALKSEGRFQRLFKRWLPDQLPP